MAKTSKFEELADRILDLTGGKENIVYFAHCVTRLRFNVKDKSLVGEEKIRKITGVIGCQWSGEQFQIIIGQAVGDAYNLICEKTGLKNEAAVEEKEEEGKKGFHPAAIIEGIAGCVSPLIHMLIAVGLLKVVVLVGELTGLMPAGSNTHTVLSFAADAGFYFMPVLVGANAARKFGANMGLGMLTGAMLIHPSFIAGVEAGTALSVFGLPIYGASYASTIFPVIMAVFVLSRVEKFFARISPAAIRSITEPFLTMLVMIPLTLCVLGPVGAFLGVYVADILMWLYAQAGFLCVGLLSAVWPYLVMTGMHAALVPYALQILTATGQEPMQVAGFISNLNQGAACLAVALKTKDTDLRATASSCALTAVLGGVTEPAMFGVTLPLKKPMIGAMIGSFLGGIIAGFLNVHVVAFAGSSGLFGLPVFLEATVSNLLYALLAMAIGFVCSFIATMVLYKEETVS